MPIFKSIIRKIENQKYALFLKYYNGTIRSIKTRNNIYTYLYT